VTVACLVPAAPVLLPALTGRDVPEVDDVRAAVDDAVGAMAGLDRVVVVAPPAPGTLAGFGAPGTVSSDHVTSWADELAGALLDRVPGAPTERPAWTWDDLGEAQERAGAPVAARDVDGWLDRVSLLPGRTGLLLLADGSRTRGPRAPGGDDPRGAVVDEELAAALRERRDAHVPEADQVGATAATAVAALAQLGRRLDATAAVTYAAAPLGVGYLVAVLRAAGEQPR
jgi:hypothetical protein